MAVGLMSVNTRFKDTQFQPETSGMVSELVVLDGNDGGVDSGEAVTTPVVAELVLLDGDHGGGDSGEAVTTPCVAVGVEAV